MINKDLELKKILLEEQKNEITGHLIYKKLSGKIRDQNNAEVLNRISQDELRHYNHFKSITGEEVKPNMVKVYFYYFLSLFFGITFGIKLLENSEIDAQKVYSKYTDDLPLLLTILEEEENHELELISMINEKKLNYIGSIVLGLNDALVELTGALAGYTFAFQNTRIIALTGLITGISASFSMAASEYLSTKHEEGERAKSAALYTGIAYIITVVFLLLPFLLFENPFISLITTLIIAVLIILIFNYYVSVAKDYNFKQRFLEMVVISLGVSAISFLIGVIVKQVFNIDL